MGCILCAVGIGSITLLAKKLGLGEAVIIIWLSGLNTATAFLLSDIIPIKIIGKRFLLASIFYGAAYFYLVKTGQMNDRIFISLTVGMEIFFVAHFIERFIFRKNNNKSLIPFQKVLIPVVLLTIASLLAAVKAF